MKNKISAYLWLWLPIVYCLLLSSGYMVVNVLMSPHKSNLGTVIYALLFILVYGLIAAPVMSIIYCRRIRTMGKKKYFCCVYNAFMMSWYFTICMHPSNFISVLHSMLSIPWISVFFASLFCGVITLVICDLKKTSKEWKCFITYKLLILKWDGKFICLLH